MNRIKLIVAMLVFSSSIAAQTENQLWSSITVTSKVARKTRVDVSFMNASSMSNKFTEVFNQGSLSVDYQLTKAWNVETGLNILSPINTLGNRMRYYVRAAYNTKVGDHLRWTNAVRVEHNSEAETRFRQRVILSTRLAAQDRLTSLRLTPFVSYSLFYNIGGAPIRYYSGDGLEIAKQSPDGFHRGRLTLGANSKINDYTRISLSYMIQNEFNFLTPETRKMNVTDPLRNRVLRPFNDFNAVLLNLTFDISKVIKKKK